MTCTKVKYYSRKEAKRWKRRGGMRNGGTKGSADHASCRAYLCKCGFWHLGHLAPDVRSGLVGREVMGG
jgi:hypothetical protein